MIKSLFTALAVALPALSHAAIPPPVALPAQAELSFTANEYVLTGVSFGASGSASVQFTNTPAARPTWSALLDAADGPALSLADDAGLVLSQTGSTLVFTVTNLNIDLANLVIRGDVRTQSQSVVTNGVVLKLFDTGVSGVLGVRDFTPSGCGGFGGYVQFGGCVTPLGPTYLDAGTLRITPVPEPSTWALVGLGLFAAARIARREAV